MQHEEKQFIVATANLALEGRRKIIVDAAAATAVLNPLLHHVKVIDNKDKAIVLQKAS